MKRFAKACAAVSMALMMSTAVGFAAETEHPNMDHGTTNKAAVSDEVDTALKHHAENGHEVHRVPCSGYSGDHPHCP